jgi:hypothetical protein
LGGRIDITIGYTADPGSDIQLVFFFGAVKRDWLLILALQTTFNAHYFVYVVLELVTNSLPYTAAMIIIIVKNTIKRELSKYGQKINKIYIP